MQTRDFGAQLRSWRLAAGYGLRQFAKLIGELPSNLSAIETGKRPPWRATERLRAVADALAFDEGSIEWDRFFLAARKTGAIPSDIDRSLDRQGVVAFLRTVDEMQLTDDELNELVAFIREGRFRDGKQARRRRSR